MTTELWFAHVKCCHTRLRDLAARFARVLPARSALSNRGRRECRAPMRPIAACAMSSEMRTRVSQVNRNHPAFPAQWFYGFLRALPGDRLSCHRHQRKLPFANLTPAPGRQDHTTSPSAGRIARQARTQRPPHPAPRFVTLRNAPLCGAGWRDRELICHFGKPEYFCKRDLTEGSINRPGDLPVGFRSRPKPSAKRLEIDG